MFHDRGRTYLIVAGSMSAAVAVLHLAVIVIGPPAYRYFGAPDEFARQAEAGSYIPAVLTGFFALIFAVWAVYAFGGARVIHRPPLVRAGLVAIAAIYVLRGLSAVPELLVFARGPRTGPGRFIVFSLVSLAIGLCYALGTRQAWRRLGHPH